MLAEPLPPGFGFSDTAFRIFILMASRRLRSDRFFTNDYSPDVYTPEGRWVEESNMSDVLLRHHRSSLRRSRASRAFAPWKRILWPWWTVSAGRASSRTPASTPRSSSRTPSRASSAPAPGRARGNGGQRRRTRHRPARGHEPLVRARPVWVKVARDDAVLLLDPKDTARLLEESPTRSPPTPTPSATAWSTSGPRTPRSRGAEWKSRRACTEAVLGERPACGSSRSPARRSATWWPAIREHDRELHWEPWNRRSSVTRRVILGDTAARRAGLPARSSG